MHGARYLPRFEGDYMLSLAPSDHFHASKFKVRTLSFRLYEATDTDMPGKLDTGSILCIQDPPNALRQALLL